MGFLASTEMSIPFSVKGQASAQYLVPSASYTPQNNGLAFKNGRPKLELHYSVPQSALLEPACLWVDTSADFERIWFAPRFPDLLVLLVHPRSDVLIQSGYDAFEMELLRDFASTPEGAFLSAWLEAIGKTIEDQLSYNIDGIERTERFGLHLGNRRKNTRRLLSGATASFYAEFARWKERHLRVTPDEE
jgi:hypothetical protein